MPAKVGDICRIKQINVKIGKVKNVLIIYLIPLQLVHDQKKPQYQERQIHFSNQIEYSLDSTRLIVQYISTPNPRQQNS